MSVASGPHPQRSSGYVLALLIGFTTVVAANGSFSLLTGRDLDVSEEWGVYLFQMLVVAAPFAFLSLAGVRGRSPWGAALAVTATLWGVYLGAALRARGDGTGANIGLGLLMLVSPALVAAAGFLAAKLTKRS